MPDYPAMDPRIPQTVSHNDENMEADVIGDNSTIGLALTSPQDQVMSATVTHFARKLYNMLEDHSIQSIVCWGPKRDCFIVKDTNEFSKSILPRVFNHSNFASFVRQLNKYDFHKLKQTEFNQTGDQTYTFRHQNFHGDRPDDLPKIQRKLTSTRASGGASSGSLPSDKSNSTADSSSSLPYESFPNQLYTLSSKSNSTQSHSTQSHSRSNEHNSSVASRENMKSEIEQLKEENEDLRGRIRNLEKNHNTMQTEMSGMTRALEKYNGQMQGLMNFFGSMSIESGTSVSLALNQASSMSASMSTSMLSSSTGGPGSIPAIATNTRTAASLNDPPQAFLPTIRDMPARISGSQAQEIYRRQQVDQRGERGQFSTRKVDPPIVRFSDNLDAQHLTGFDPTHSASPSRSMAIFGNLGQVNEATLMQTRELSRLTAAGLSSGRAPHGRDRGAGLWSGIDFGETGPYTISEWSEMSSNSFPSPQTGQHISQDTEMGEVRQDREEERSSDVHAERSSQQLESNLPPTSSVSNFGMQESVGRIGRKGRSLSFGDQTDFQARSFAAVGPPRLGGQDSDGPYTDSFIASSEQRMELESEQNRERLRRRGSDGATFLHRSNRGQGRVVVDMPLPTSVEMGEGWSFDTTVLATPGMLGITADGLPLTSEESLSFSKEAPSHSLSEADRMVGGSD